MADIFGTDYFCRAWVITRRDGVQLGFTDHDNALVVGGVVCDPATGFLASQWAEVSGLTVSDMSAAGVIAGDVLNEKDIESGFYDLAFVDFYGVDWQTGEAQIIAKTQIHEINRDNNGIEFDLRGLSAKAASERAAIFSRRCGLDYGGARDPENGRGCGIDLTQAEFHFAGPVETVRGVRQFTVAAASFAAGWFNNGLITWTSGANIGVDRRVRASALENGGQLFTFDRGMPNPVQVGDEMKVVGGCDGSFTSCKIRENARRFGGTFAPVEDVATKYKIEGVS